MQENPLTLSDGRVLATFYILHPEDTQFNAPNQRYWKQYHKFQHMKSISHQYHLVSPSKNEHSYCKKHSLVAHQEWTQLYDRATFILGPFDFARIRGRHTKDRVPSSIWTQLHSMNLKTDNNLPSVINALCGYICHVDTPFHSVHSSKSVTATINAVLLNNYFD